MPDARFLVYNALGGVLWAVGCAARLPRGASRRVAEAWMGRVGMGIGALAVVAAVLVWRRRRGRARARGATAA